MTDENRAAYRKRRMAELLAEAEANRDRSRAEVEALEQEDPVAEVRRGSWSGHVLLYAVLLVVSFVLIATSMTIGRFTGFDFSEADRVGTATVQSCERHGPVGWSGFGYYDACTVTVDWGRNGTRLSIDKPGFFKGEKPGDTFKIGENKRTKGRVGYSRAELPDRGWVTFAGVVVAIVGALPLLLLLFLVRDSVRSLFRRRRE